MLLFKLAISIQTATVGAAVDAGDLNMPSKRRKLRGLTLNTEVKVLESELSFREREQWSSLTRDLNSVSVEKLQMKCHPLAPLQFLT